jgi:hypothetical protein
MLEMPSVLAVVGENIDTFIANIHGKLSDDLAAELDLLKEASQEADDDVPTAWTFAGETLYIKAHGSGRQWRWILHCPSLHLDVGRGKLNGIVGKARLASACLWELGPEKALATLYAFLVAFYGGESFHLQVSEIHLCVDVAGWDLTLADARAFVSRSRRRKGRLVQPDEDDDPDNKGWEAPELEVNTDGRLCTGFEFSKTAPHSCTLYDKTKEIRRSRKDWMQAIWLRYGWDGAGRVIRVEFRYEREVLRELGVEDPFVFFDQLPSLWAYSTQHWLRHTAPTPADPNRWRWPISPVWQAVQQAEFYGNGEPAVRERRTKGDLRLICQMLAGCSTKAAALLANALPQANAADFLTWFYDWMAAYHQEKGVTFEGLRDEKRQRLGIVLPSGGSHAAA